MIPYGRQSIGEDDIAAVAQVLRGDMLTGGPAVERFERALAGAVSAPHALVCANGTAALHLVAMALGLGTGDRVIVPSVTFLASANAFVFAGADVQLADVDPDTGLLTPETLRAALSAGGSGRARAVVAVHLNGQVCDMEGIAAVASEHGLVVIEDACHALGAFQDIGGRKVAVGSSAFSAAACFSFHPVKTVAMGEGGAVTTRDATLAERVARLRNHGMVRDPAVFTQPDEAIDADGQVNPWYYEMPEPGLNYRACDIQCALGESQLRKLTAFLDRRRALAARYDELLAPLAPLLRPVPRHHAAGDGWHLYPVLIDFAASGKTRAKVMAGLRGRGIGTQVHYLPVYRQPFYRARNEGLTLPGADAYYARCLSLPLFPAMDDRDPTRVVDALRSTLEGAE